MRILTTIIILGIIMIILGLGPFFSFNNFYEEKNSLSNSNSIKGPLKVNPLNPRYFTDDTNMSIYLTGSHTWNNLQDDGLTDPPLPFNFSAYLDFLKKYNHNFIRMWIWELSKYSYYSFAGEYRYVYPFPWLRTGPGTSLDGKPKFDLNQFDQAYFDRLRSRIEVAGRKGIYVSIMFFEGHGLQASSKPWCWDGHPFNIQNNINEINGGIDGDGRGIEIHTLEIPAITALQEAYVRKVIDTVNDLDNVLYEIANESGKNSTEWQYYFINYIHEYEKCKPKQHPVGMTVQLIKPYDGRNEILFNSSADWISPGTDPADNTYSITNGSYQDDPPIADGSKVIIIDTDHLWGIGGNQAWVWKSFCRGMNPIFMDPYLSKSTSLDPQWNSIRKNLGYTLEYASRMNLTNMIPCNELASTKYCLANPGVEYLIYLPDGGSTIVDLSKVSGKLIIEWFNPSTGKRIYQKATAFDDYKEFSAPFEGDAVLYIVVQKNL